MKRCDTTCGLKTCQSYLACDCCSITYRNIDEVVYHAKEYIASISGKHNVYLTKKIGLVNTGIIPKISYYIWALEQEMELLYRGIQSCLKNSWICDMVEKLKSFLPIICYPKKRRDDIKTEDGLQDWLAGNTGCVSFESYSKYLYNIAVKFDIQVDRQSIVLGTNVCDFTMGVFRKAIPEKLVLELKRTPLHCSSEFKIDRISNINKCDLIFDLQMYEQCLSEYKLLVEELKCDMKPALYIELIKCGLDHRFIKEAVTCGFNFCVVDQQTKCKLDFNNQDISYPCNVNYCNTLIGKDVCIENNTASYNLTSINFH